MVSTRSGASARNVRHPASAKGYGAKFSLPGEFRFGDHLAGRVDQLESDFRRRDVRDCQCLHCGSKRDVRQGHGFCPLPRVRRGHTGLGHRELGVRTAPDSQRRGPPAVRQELQQVVEPQHPVPLPPVVLIGTPGGIVQMEGDNQLVGIRRLDRGHGQCQEDLCEVGRRAAPFASPGNSSLFRQLTDGVLNHGWQLPGNGVRELPLQNRALHVGGLEQAEQVCEHGTLPCARISVPQEANEQLERRLGKTGADRTGIPQSVQRALQLRHAAIVTAEHVQRVVALAEHRFEIVPCQRPHQIAGSDQREAFRRILVGPVPVIFEAVHEHGDRRLVRRFSCGANHEVRAAGDLHPVGLAKLDLGLHVPRTPRRRQDVAGLAADDVLPHAHRGGVHVDATERFDEACFQLALQHRVHLDGAKAVDLLQILRLLENCVQHRHRRVAGRAGHLAAAPIGVHAAVATVLQRVGVARALRERVARHAEDGQHVVRIGHHLLQVAGAARHRVVEHQEVDTRSRFRRREPAGHHPQMIHRPRKPTPQAQLQGGDEGAHALVGIHAPGRGDEHPHRFGPKLAVEVEAVHDRLLAAGIAGTHVLDLAVGALHASAPSAQRETLARHGLAGEHGGRVLTVHAAEVHLPKGGSPHVLEAERLPGIAGRKGMGDGTRVEIRDQLPRVEQRFTVIALVHDAAVTILGRGMDQAQAQHFPSLSGVAPQRIAAARAGAVPITGFDVLAIGAGRAEPPLLDGRHPGVDASNRHAAPAGVELVLRSKLAQRGRGWARVVIDDGVVLIRLCVALLGLASLEDHGLQRHALLREGVVGKQSLVGQESEGVSLVDLLQQLLQRSALAGELLDGIPARIVGRTVLNRPDTAAQGFDVVAQGLAFLHHLRQAIQDAQAQRGFRIEAVKELAEVSARRVVDSARCPGTCLECPEEPREQVVTVLHDEVEERIGKSLGIRPFHVVQHGAYGARHGTLVHTARHPAIETERGELPFQHGGGVQEDAGRLDPAAQHFHRLRVVVQIVRLSGRDRERQRIAVAPSRASGALHVVHRRRRNRAHHDGGQVADVHSELEGRRGGEQVRLPGLDVRRREPLLETIALLPGHQRGVLGGYDAANVRLPVEVSRPGRTPGCPPDIALLSRRIEAGDALPHLGLAGRDNELPR